MTTGCDRRALTLIELTLVLVILGIITGAVVIRIQGPLGRARLDDAIDAVAGFDRLTRLAAVQQDRPFRMAFDLSRGRLSRTDLQGKPAGVELKLPGGFEMRRLIVRRQDADTSSLAVSCSRHGRTPTYAVLLEGAGRKQWLVTFGLTGKQIRLDSEQQVREILAATGVRHDAG